MFAVLCGAEVQFSGASPSTYPSSDWAERGFCGKCGTHLFYRLLASNEYALSAGLFEKQEFELTTEIFIEEKPAFYEFKNETKKLTAQQVFEQFSPQ